MTRIWKLPFPITPKLEDAAKPVRLAVFDVDGVLTDGSVTYGPQGEEYKSFSVLDGQGLKLLGSNGIVTALASARGSPALTVRARELEIEHVETGQPDKRLVVERLCRKLDIAWDQCCFVGDDLVDIPAMLKAGMAVAVANAHHSVKHVAHWTTPSQGGHGAVREVCDVILYAQDRLDEVMDKYMSFTG